MEHAAPLQRPCRRARERTWGILRTRYHAAAMRPIATERHRTNRAVLHDVCCNLGPADRPYPETHAGWCIALVRRGTFSYHAHDAPRGRELRPGWLLLGRDGAEFECRHPHTGGDDCISLH